MILVPLFDLKFLTELCCRRCRNFKSAALASNTRLARILAITHLATKPAEASKPGVLLRHHAVEHRDREHRVDPRGHAGEAPSRCFIVRRGLDHPEDLLLVWPDD